MKVVELLNEALPVASEDDMDPGHVTAKTFMDIMRQVKAPGFKLRTAGQPRTNKSSRVVTVGIDVTDNKANANAVIDQMLALVHKQMSNVTYKVEPGYYNGRHPNQPDQYYVSFKAELTGLSKERLDFANYAKKLAQKFAKAGNKLFSMVEIRKEGVIINVSNGMLTRNTAVDEYIDDLIEKFGDRLEVHPDQYNTEIRFT